MGNFRDANHSDLLKSTLARVKHLDVASRLSYDKSAHPFSGGSYGDIRIGTYDHPDHGKLKVAVKCLRVFHAQTPGIVKLISREVRVWSSLDHPNILPLLGYILEENDFPTLISEFMEHGTAMQYVIRNPAADVPGLILGIAEGVQYLHNKGIVHSDIKSDNVLISQDGRPLVCDFGVSRVISLSTSCSGYDINAQSTSGGVKGSARWMSREILYCPDSQLPSKHTMESDIWAFGMTGYELLTKKRPYHELANDLQVISAICNGCLPKTPEDFHTWPVSSQSAWELCNSCWSKDPSDRPGLQVIVWVLKATRAGNVAIVNSKFAESLQACRSTRSGQSKSMCRRGRFTDVFTEVNEGREVAPVDTEVISETEGIKVVTGTKVAISSDHEKEGKIQQPDDYNESVRNLRSELAVLSLDHPYRASSLLGLAKALYDRFRATSRVDELEESIELLRSALSLPPERSPDRVDSLECIALCLMSRFKLYMQTEDVRQATVYLRTALTLCPAGLPDHDRLLRYAGYCLNELSEITEQVRDIEEAISTNRACLARHTEGDPTRHTTLNNLAFGLYKRFKKERRPEDINESIALHRAALELRPDGHPDRDRSLCNLALSLFSRFEQGGSTADLEEAIVLDRSALSLRKEGHPDRSATLNNLGYYLLLSFNQYGKLDDLDEAIQFLYASLALRPEGHPDRTLTLLNLSDCFAARYHRFLDARDREEAVALVQAAGDVKGGVVEEGNSRPM